MGYPTPDHSKAWQRLKEAAALPRHYANGAVIMEVRKDGIKLTGFKDLDPGDGAATFLSHTVSWLEMEASNFDLLAAKHADLVSAFGLVEKEDEDAGG